MRASIALLISGFAAQHVAAHWNRQASNYNTPQYNNNECSNKQQGGYDWSDLRDGDKPGKYDDFDFGDSWSCKSKFGRRDHITKRTFGGKVLSSKCGKEQPASFSCDKKDGFSVTHIDVSVDHDADLDFHYKMKDGSICKQRASCKKEGTTVTNTQCGGAQSVDVYLGNSSEGREDCEIGFHQIGFDCNPGEQYTPPPPYTPAPPPETTSSPPPPENTPPPTECGGEGQPGCESSTASPPESSSSVESSTPPPENTPPPPPPPPSTECGGYNQPACETTTPPPAESTPPPAESTPPPAESTPPPAESTPPPAESTPTPTPSTSQSVRTPICGGGYGPSCGNSTAPPENTPTPPPAESSPVSTPAESSSAPPPESSSSPCGGYGQPACDTTTPPAESTPAESTPAESTPAESTPAESTPAESTPAESTPAESTPAESTPAESTPAESTPATSTPAESSSTPPPAESTPPTYGNSTTSTPEASTSVPPSSSSPPTYTPPPGGYTPPDCLPKCLNTWLKLKSECKDNTDSACYCKVPDLTDNVIDCVKAHGTEEEVKEALSYFVGICAPQVPENPGIISKCTDVPLSPPTPAPETPVTPAPGAPTPAPPAPAPPTDIPYTTVTFGGSSYTVPQVGFTTETPGAPGANPTEPIALYPAPTPAPAPATPTPAVPYPVPSGFTSIVGYPTGTGAGAVPSQPSEFTGAASTLNSKVKGVGVVFGAVLAFFAL